MLIEFVLEKVQGLYKSDLIDAEVAMLNEHMSAEAKKIIENELINS